jgi:hypothetical protein
MLYRYAPACPMEQIPRLGLLSPGNVADLDAAQVAFALGNTAGADGGPCLIPLAPAVQSPPPAASEPAPVSVAGATLSAGKTRKRRGA